MTIQLTEKFPNLNVIRGCFISKKKFISYLHRLSAVKESKTTARICFKFLYFNSVKMSSFSIPIFLPISPASTHCSTAIFPPSLSSENSCALLCWNRFLLFFIKSSCTNSKAGVFEKFLKPKIKSPL